MSKHTRIYFYSLFRLLVVLLVSSAVYEACWRYKDERASSSTVVSIVTSSRRDYCLSPKCLATPHINPAVPALAADVDIATYLAAWFCCTSAAHIKVRSHTVPSIYFSLFFSVTFLVSPRIPAQWDSATWVSYLYLRRPVVCVHGLEGWVLLGYVPTCSTIIGATIGLRSKKA